MNPRKEFKRLVWPLIKWSPIIGVTVIIAFVGARHYIKYSTPLYQATASLKIDNRDYGLSNINILENSPSGSTIASNYLTEVEVIKSKQLKRKAFKNLDFDVTYQRVGKIAIRRLYHDCPFWIDFKMEDSMLYNRTYFIRYVEDKTFELFKDQEFENSLGSIKFGDSTRLIEGLPFKLMPRLSYLENNPDGLHIGDQFSFKINSASALVGSVNNENLFIKPIDKEVYIVKLYYKHAHPEMASRFLNALMDKYIEEDRQSKINQARQALDFVDNEIIRVRDELLNLEGKLSRYRRKERIINPTLETDALLKRLNQIELQYTQFKLQELELKNVYEYLSSSEGLGNFSPDFQLIKDGIFKKNFQKVKDLEMVLEELLDKYTEKNDKVQSVRKKIDTLRDFTLNSLQKQLLNISKEKNVIQNDINQLEDRLRLIPEKERNLVALERDFRLVEQNYNYLTKKRSELAIAESSKVSFHKVIEYASIPTHTISPNKAMIYGLMIFLALILSIALVYVIHFTTAQVMDQDDIKEVVNFPLLGEVAKYHRKKVLSPTSTLLNLYNNLQILESEKSLETLSIVSAQRQVGRTFIAIQLAELLAGYGRNILLVDMDFGHQEILELLGVDNQFQLSDLLDHKNEITDFIQSTPNPNLHLLSLQADPILSEKWLYSPHFESFINSAKERFDTVVIDTTAVKEGIEAAALMRLCDMNLYVVKKGKTKKRSLHEFLGFSQKFHLENIFVAFNGV